MYNVLIAEDEIIVRAWLKKQVQWEKYGMRVAAEAGSGRAALEAFEQGGIDVVLTDLRMPGMDGISLLEAIREKDRRVRLLVLTCLDEQGLMRKASAQNVTSYILKLTAEPEKIEEELAKAQDELLLIDGVSDRENIEGDQKESKNVKNQRFEAAMAYLRNHYTEDISLSSVSERVGVTPNYLGRLFLQLQGGTFTDALNRLRICQAKALLEDPAYRIHEVATLCGFFNAGYFFRVFKKYEGCTPTEYRAVKGEKNV